MPQVKICGIGELNHALVAAQAGADYIGLVFVPERRRRVAPDTAREIIAGVREGCPKPPKAVGLFAGQPLEEVSRLSIDCGLDLAQLCSGESLEFCDQLRAETGVKVIRVVHVPDDGGDASDGIAETLNRFQANGHLITLDRLVAGLQGGTGQSFDWNMASQLAQQGHDFFLAGGLTPDNVARAVATVQPWGVDVSTGVETNGVKDNAKIRAFISNAKGEANAKNGAA